MSLYWCVFADGREIDSVEPGASSDFNAFRASVAASLPPGRAEARFSTLMLHSDCEGEWSVEDCARLRIELTDIAVLLQERPAVALASWQRKVAAAAGLRPRTAFESFIDIEGEPLIERLSGLVETALKTGQPILFQ